ncbi:hypothetical protein SOVF_020320 [Spinacia oleracea]|uniref:Uncharacterized protein n=1 Tax=Spinacia oleracea TaxID=3562 RepID=A0A9R0IEI1_SPIOL|nr:uncharacterized protein LOC110787469 [Spinacia oleracea]KNA23960.1 hypothetical protein SOVF_020320 [Spinacia oleracea]
MASTASSFLPDQQVRRNTLSTTTRPPRATAAASAHLPSSSTNRRGHLIFTATTILTTALNLPSSSSPANAKDIPLFGLRKKLEKAEEQAAELVKEGFESVEKGLDSVESGIESAEKGVAAAEQGIENAAESASFSGLTQAGFVGGAEFLGVVIGTSVVNGILSSQPQKS